eukprot:1141749-Pelagomonas_calceolata.AAC.1
MNLRKRLQRNQFNLYGSAPPSSASCLRDFINQADVLGLYASQIWATAYPQQGTEMDDCIQKWLLRFLRSILGLQTSTPSWSILRECGVEPI